MNSTLKKFCLVLQNTKFFVGFFFSPKNSYELVNDAEGQTPRVLLWDEGDVHGKLPQNVTKDTNVFNSRPNLKFR